MTKKLELAGQKFNMLLVIEDTGKRSAHSPIWRCKCDCGNETFVSTQHLRDGSTKSCGCYRRKHCSILGKKGMSRRLPYGEASFYRVYLRYRKNAKRRGYTFSLSETEFRILTKQKCHYCGAEPLQIEKNNNGSGDYIYNGIDRKDNSIGYTTKNCVPCCKYCNIAKGTLSKRDFLDKIDKIYTYNFTRMKHDT